MSTRSLHHGFLQQIHRRSTRNSTTSGLRWLPIFPEKGSRHPHLFHLEMSEVPDEEVPIYRTPQHSRPAPLNLMKCFFHLCQSFQKRISKSFRKLYRTDKAFARASRLVAFLAFVPLDSIEDAFEASSIHIAGLYPELNLSSVSQGVLEPSCDHNGGSRIS